MTDFASPVAKVDDVAHVRFRAPDLEMMRDFLLDFGMVEAGRDGNHLYMRGHSDAPFVHVTEHGPAGFAGFAFRVSERSALEALAHHEGVEIQALDTPGGGEVVRLLDPDGFAVEIVHGQAAVAPLAAPSPGPWNEAGRNDRVSAFRRPPKGPSHVLRLGHVVLSVSDFRVSERWYKERFGLITSDEIQPAPGIGIGAFMRADRGSERTCDHHTLFLFQHPAGPTYLHSAFEVIDLDDLMTGRDHLLAKGHDAAWGVGRHKLGSQIFDYWRDPWGHEVEHWTDGDQLYASDGGRVATPEELIGVQWGMGFPGKAGDAE
ncbi:VOC family protein [Novosphingobium sp.]|uniref:VOC family protein n=1 Tax=Novosphingobium sp. TaxID=1874826 RepID=UPI00262233C3|nr:VOC family protein [Novosphingobium sp.]